VPGTGAIHSAPRLASVSVRSGLTEMIRHPRATADASSGAMVCRPMPPEATAEFFGDNPPNATSSSVCSAMTGHAVAPPMTTPVSPTTCGSSTDEVPKL
jgi:hypothetical protein